MVPLLSLPRKSALRMTGTGSVNGKSIDLENVMLGAGSTLKKLENLTHHEVQKQFIPLSAVVLLVYKYTWCLIHLL